MGGDCEVPVLRLRQTLKSCAELTEAGEFVKCEEELSELVEFLNSVYEAITNEEDGFDQSTAFEILTEIHHFISSPSQNQAVIDELSFVLPKLAARLGCASQKCLDMAVMVVECFTGMCDSREMLTILIDALDSPDEMFRIPAYFIPLLAAFPKVFVSLRPRRAVQQVKSALPVILQTLNSESRDDDDDEDDDDEVHVVKLFQTGNRIADSIKTVCLILQGEDSNKLRTLLGLFVLQTLSLLSMAITHRLADSLPLVMHLSQLLPFCGLSYANLITDSHVSDLLHMALGDDDDDDDDDCFSRIRLGASLAVIWGFKCNEVAIAAEEDVPSLVHELQTSHVKRWEALGMLKHVFLCATLPWELKKQAINFMLSILDRDSPTPHDQEDADCDESTTISLYATLQAIQKVLMFSPDAVIRTAFAAFKRLLSDIPSSPRFDMLRAMIQKSGSSTMTGMLLDCVKVEMGRENSKRRESGSCFWSDTVLEFVELVLRPPGGGPPLLPDSYDAVVGALNLCRFILMNESTGKTNYTGILCQDRLKKIHSEWLMPLRGLVMDVAAENDKHGDQVVMDVLCGRLNSISFVLYQCIELTEQHLKH